MSTRLLFSIAKMKGRALQESPGDSTRYLFLTDREWEERGAQGQLRRQF